MSINVDSTLTVSFDNPFEDINANIIDPHKILEFWCDPFKTGGIKDIDEKKFCSQRLPIILQGSRGSGKTTILKYFSFPVQKERAKLVNNFSIVDQIQSEGGVGFYLRCDDSFINTFRVIFENHSKDRWLLFFEHFIELYFCKNILSMLMDLNESGDINYSIYENNILHNLYNQTGNAIIEDLKTFEDLYRFIFDQMRYIDMFKNKSIYTKEDFMPKILLRIFDISSSIISSLCEYEEKLKNIVYVLMIDEFENLPNELQKFFNTLIKFVRPNISIRIGRRSEGNVTTETVNAEEYLREKHDYFLVVLDKKLSTSEIKNYFKEVATKRLSSSNIKSQSVDIVDMLGDMEDLNNECIEICKTRKDHLNYILNESPSLRYNESIKENIISIIANDSNPIAESLNALWVIRSKNSPIEAAKNAKFAMDAYFNKTPHPDVAKYANDYINKYKYAITILICSAHKKNKLYYGFNTICHLSNGNIRTFLNICRSVFSDALFYEKEHFIQTRTITKESQSRAIHEFSISEFENVCSIIKYGNSIRNLIMNIGNVFVEFHKDYKIRYPETNQFVFNKLELNDATRAIIDTAESWTMIIKREVTQRISVDINKKGDIFYINRAFSPIFNISYRIRGGFNIQFNKNEIEEMTTTLTTKKKLTRSKQQEADRYQRDQLTIFDIGGEDD